ncbi:MAG: phage tail protein, partial [Wohlfahrtiimonas sp.]
MPFFTAIIALIGTIGTFVASLGGIGAALLSIGLNLAAQYVLKLFAKKPPSGVELEVQFGESISRTVSYGLTASAGHLVYVNSYGSANSMLQHLRVISDFYTTSLEKVYINGKLETLGIENYLGKVVSSGEFANRIWIKYVDGRQTTPDPLIISNSNPAGRYDATDSLLGCSYVIITMSFDREVLNSVPEFLFEYKGAPIYDWRKDTSVGGLGAHRYNDINTWEYSANPILLAYAYHRGIKINGDLFAGMEVAESDLPLGKWSTACNICDEIVDTEKRFAISFQVNCSETHGNNIDAIMRSCGGFISEGVEGIWPIVGSNQTVVATFTDDDIIVNSSKNFRRYRPMSELVNSVSGTFISPEQQWSSAGYTRAFDNGLLTVDRRTRDVDMNFDTVNSLRQASQLASIYFRENRYEKTATLTLRPFFQDL